MLGLGGGSRPYAARAWICRRCARYKTRKIKPSAHPLLLDEFETLREMLMDGRLGPLLIEVFRDGRVVAARRLLLLLLHVKPMVDQPFDFQSPVLVRHVLFGRRTDDDDPLAAGSGRHHLRVRRLCGFFHFVVDDRFVFRVSSAEVTGKKKNRFYNAPANGRSAEDFVVRTKRIY